MAAWLIAHSDRSVTLVGHTDATGSLAVNIALSKSRAQSVLQALKSAGVPLARLIELPRYLKAMLLQID